MNIDMDYIKTEAAKQCYWLKDGVFNLPEWTRAMMQIATDRAGSKINSMKRDLDACRPYLKEGETAADALIRLAHAESFYRRRCEALQAWQSSMRNPERVIVCDILANGFTLDQPLSGDRYAGLMPASPPTTEE